MRQNAEIQNLYKKNNVSMFGSFATFLTLPIMFAMWQAVQRIDILYSTYIFGINLGAKPISHIMDLDIAYIVLLVLVAGTQFFAMQITQIMATNEVDEYNEQCNDDLHCLLSCYNACSNVVVLDYNKCY